MKILVKALGFNPGEALQRHAVHRLQSVLARWAGRMGKIVVRILDTNGPRGGVDKACSILLRAPRRTPVMVSAISGDYYAAVDLAAHRAERALTRMFERRPRAKALP